ncbi:unnamed protein product [Heligmosomoides polygyrus]|uniref:MSP domain-containing protein n=1 Tax=Heligmosomoides polygyrus TaxID=6339 RepID=A0A183FBN1_HELPZ|nr:unnamed protein product [Heligmosomoides polygyrus]
MAADKAVLEFKWDQKDVKKRCVRLIFCSTTFFSFFKGCKIDF